MIDLVSGDLLTDGADVLVNPVNVVGVMGKGLALQFKRAFPTNFSVYRGACQRGELQVGVILAVRVDDRWIVNLPTKRHWRQPSRLPDVAVGLDGLVEFLLSNPVESVAIPPFGAGNGGLPWPRVRDLIHEKLEPLDLSIRLYQPAASGR